jgi:tetratricopeptide (TPR) repeat protein
VFSRIRVLSLAVLLLAADRLHGQEDLRKQYHTPSVPAAEKIAAALAHVDAGDAAKALADIEEALEADPKCVFATFHKARLLRNQGKAPEAIEAYKKVVAAGKRIAILRTSVAAQAMIELGTVYSQLKEYDEGNKWFTELILYGYNTNLEAAAYRNLAINRHFQNRSLAAEVAGAWGRHLDETAIEQKMIDDFSRDSMKEDFAPILRFDEEIPKIPKRAFSPLTPIKLGADIGELVVQIMTDPTGRYVVILAEGVRGYYLVRTDLERPAGALEIKKVTFDSEIGCGCLIDGRLYLVPLGRSKLVEVEPESGTARKVHAIGGQTTYSVAVFPRHGMAYFTRGMSGVFRVHRLNLETGEVAETPLYGQEVVGDPRQRFLYCLSRAASGGETTDRKSVV